MHAYYKYCLSKFSPGQESYLTEVDSVAVQHRIVHFFGQISYHTPKISLKFLLVTTLALVLFPMGITGMFRLTPLGNSGMVLAKPYSASISQLDKFISHPFIELSIAWI